jgi:ATP-dependent DNA helicase RecG
LPALVDAIRYTHRPPPDAAQELLEKGIHPAQQRLAFEELLAHQMSLIRLRLQTQQHNAPALLKNGIFTEKFLQQLSFTLTMAQQRVITEIANDLAQTKPMMRLVQGDVGSGKTVVAALAALQVIENNFQAAVMAPTELLAEQHFNNFQRWLDPLGLNVAWLAGKLQGKAKEKVLQEIASGKIHLLIGTHALFQEGVEFSNLALIVVDEQHRFGVHQRLALREKGMKNGFCPHQLIMTATPIPRTLAMTAYADLDSSVIDELPPGRMPVTTVIVTNQRRSEVIQRLRQNCLSGKQAYWVCTLIEESESLQCQAAEATAAQLIQALPELQIGLVHGRMKTGDKEQIMQAFKHKKIDLLVATTVIEVGVDVPNAGLMIIENPERLGLAQLHQLRGRVGRGNMQSHCVLLYQSPLSIQAKQRLSIMRDAHDGFEIAQKDLELRGPGEVLGTKQTGLMQFKIANLLRDKNLLPEVQKTAKLLLKQYPDKAELLMQRWLKNSEQYGNV